MKSRLIGLIVAMALCFWCAPVMAYDPVPDDMAGWFNFVGEGDNVVELGLLTQAELEGEDFQRALAGTDPINRIWSPIEPGIQLVKVQDLVVENFQVDNRIFAGDRKPDSRVKFRAFRNVTEIAFVRAVQINDPGYDCTPDNNWHFNLCDDEGQPTIPNGSPAGNTYYGPYPVILYHIDWVWSDSCNQICNDVNWEPNWDDPNDPCVICHNPGDGTDLPVAFDGTLMRVAGGEQVLPQDVTVTWDDETITGGNLEHETFWPTSWDTNQNASETNMWAGGPVTEPHPMLYMTPFSKQAPMGDQEYIINVAGTEIAMTQNIFSNTLMPTVAAKTYYTDIVATKTNKSGKIIKATETQVEVDNLTAREIVDDHGNTKLLIKWAEPDRAMELVGGNTRLRIYIGDGWFNNVLNPAEAVQVNFVWMDVPLHSGSVVVPADQYAWIKQIVAEGDGLLDIGGMYREQFTGYHNRGYINGIQFPIP